MTILARWIAPAALAAALGAGGLIPAPAQARDDLIRVIVDLPDIVFRSGHPYYRHGGHGYNDRLIVERDRRGRPIYYRHVPRGYDHRDRPPYGNAYGYHRTRDSRYNREVCDSRGRCRVVYYDPRYDRRDDWRDHRDDRRHWRDRD